MTEKKFGGLPDAQITNGFKKLVNGKVEIPIVVGLKLWERELQHITTILKGDDTVNEVALDRFINGIALWSKGPMVFNPLAPRLQGFHGAVAGAQIMRMLCSALFDQVLNPTIRKGADGASFGEGCC